MATPLRFEVDRLLVVATGRDGPGVAEVLR
jgi:hypothetical protein